MASITQSAVLGNVRAFKAAKATKRCVCVCPRASRSRAVGRRRGRRAIDDDANDRERVARSIGRDLDDARRARAASEGTSEGGLR